jgi:hypothetical protein
MLFALTICTFFKFLYFSGSILQAFFSIYFSWNFYFRENILEAIKIFFLDKFDNNINTNNNNIGDNYKEHSQFYNNQPSSIDSNTKNNNFNQKQHFVDSKKDQKYYSTLLGDEYEFFKKRSMLIWAQSIDEINAMERDLLISETEQQKHFDDLYDDDAPVKFGLVEVASETPLPVRSARFSSCTSPSFEKQRRLSLISSNLNSSQGSAESGSSICCKSVVQIKVYFWHFFTLGCSFCDFFCGLLPFFNVYYRS